MRYYAEWLDGEYLLLKHRNPAYDHFAVMQRSIRLHALFGSTIVLSDAQTIDIRTPLTRLFLDPKFRDFLKEYPHFLALVADPVVGAKDQNFAIAMKGVERLANQANRPPDSFEEAITQLGEPIFHAGYFDAARYLDPGFKEKGGVGRVIRRFPQYSEQLKGLLHLVDHFTRSPLPTTTMPSTGKPERYDTLLESVSEDAKVVDELKAKRIQKILQIQREQLPEGQHGRRAAIRKLLGTGKWHSEEWTADNLRLYLDVVHAWNCAINRNVSPKGGTLYESDDDIKLSKFNRSTTDTFDWLRAGPMPTSRFSKPLLRFMSWDPLDADWNFISTIVQLTKKSAEDLQATLKSPNRKDRVRALQTHAINISNCLVNVPMKEIPEWVWTVFGAGAMLSDTFPSEAVEVAKEIGHDAPHLWAAWQRKQVVNTIEDTGHEIV